MKNTKQSVVFCDIDGCIFKVVEKGNCTKIISSKAEILPGVIEKFNEWDKAGYKIVLTTGRPNSTREVTEQQLMSYGLFWHALIMEMGSNKRFLINDIHPDYNENTAYAINLPRNTGLTDVHLEDM
jgi:histidinol phosphatase-like enzyme